MTFGVLKLIWALNFYKSVKNGRIFQVKWDQKTIDHLNISIYENISRVWLKKNF